MANSKGFFGKFLPRSKEHPLVAETDKMRQQANELLMEMVKIVKSEEIDFEKFEQTRLEAVALKKAISAKQYELHQMMREGRTE